MFLRKWLILRYFSLRWLYFTKIFKNLKNFLWVKNLGGNLSCQWPLAESKFRNFTKAMTNENMFYMQGVNICFITMRFIKVQNSIQRVCWRLLMVWFHTFWVQTEVTFFTFENGPSSTLFTSTIFLFTFQNHMIQGIKFFTCPCYSRRVERLYWLVSAILSQGFKHKFT